MCIKVSDLTFIYNLEVYFLYFKHRAITTGCNFTFNIKTKALDSNLMHFRSIWQLVIFTSLKLMEKSKEFIH